LEVGNSDSGGVDFLEGVDGGCFADTEGTDVAAFGFDVGDAVAVSVGGGGGVDLYAWGGEVY
jgi:hypothetical protein